MKRLAPAEYQFAVSHAQVRRARARYGVENGGQRALRTLRDADLHRLFKAGREVVFEKGDGSRVAHTLTPTEAKNAIVLVGLVKKIAGQEPQLVRTDAALAERAQRDLGSGWSVSTVRRTRRICAAAGLHVRPVRSDGVPDADPEFMGSVWVLDRRLAPVETQAPPRAGVNTPVVGEDHTPCIREREKPSSLRSDGSEKRSRAGPPDVEAAKAAVRDALRELRADERRSRRGRRGGGSQQAPAGSEPGRIAEPAGLHRPTLRLLAALLAERWKIRMEWGLAAALEQAVARALALDADPERVAEARGFLALRFFGEQLALELPPDGGVPERWLHRFGVALAEDEASFAAAVRRDFGGGVGDAAIEDARRRAVALVVEHGLGPYPTEAELPPSADAGAGA